MTSDKIWGDRRLIDTYVWKRKKGCEGRQVCEAVDWFRARGNWGENDMQGKNATKKRRRKGSDGRDTNSDEEKAKSQK